MTHTTALKTATAAFVLAAPFVAEPARADAGFKALAGVEAQPMTGAEMEATQGQGFEWDGAIINPRVVWNYTNDPLAASQGSNLGWVTLTNGPYRGSTAYFYYTGGYLWSYQTGNWFDFSGNVWDRSLQLIETKATVSEALARSIQANATYGAMHSIEDFLIPRY